jgi:hypothetical protein
VNADDFVAAFEERVFRSAIADTIENLEAPAGRKPPASLLVASDWFRRLGPADAAIVRSVIADAAHAAAFGALAVIDGVRPTGPYRYELTAVDDHGGRSVINPETSEDLHDLFQSRVMALDGTLRV